MENCLSYLGHLAIGQLQILAKREKLELAIESSEDPTIQEKLKLIQSVRQFSIDQLGLNPGGGFDYYTQLDREEIGWHVTASYPLKMQSYTWWFPIVGEVPYKGFFQREKAIQLQEDLKEKGLDTKLRITAGYSTLGWFSDPVLSPQLKLSEPDLVGLVIHEMSHSTIYFPGDSLFNESYASFVEDKGVEIFYNTTFPERSESILKIWKERKKLKKKLVEEFLITGRKLEFEYNSEKSDEEKYQAKKTILDSFKSKIHEMNQSNPSKILERLEHSEINNETFIGFLRYESGEEYFQRVFSDVDEKFTAFHNEIKKLELVPEEKRKELLLNAK